ncbi:MAG: hypothetical protein ABI231_12000 [Candidatus Tumulicola sp.]
MKIDFLFFTGCPNSAPTLRRLFEMLASEDIVAEVNEIEIADAAWAARHRFLGSPSIRIDGDDIDPAARARRTYGLMCRTYPGGAGIPPVDMIRRALREHLAQGRNL